MNKAAVYAPLFVALGLAAGIWRGEAGREERTEERPGPLASASQGTGVRESERRGDRHTAQLQQRLRGLMSKLAAETNARRRLEERIEVLASESRHLARQSS